MPPSTLSILVTEAHPHVWELLHCVTFYIEALSFPIPITVCDSVLKFYEHWRRLTVPAWSEGRDPSHGRGSPPCSVPGEMDKTRKEKVGSDAAPLLGSELKGQNITNAKLPLSNLHETKA